ncbi:kinesin-like protein KIN-14R [Citrus sinensis]|nr:kinesin-like protein KIN-14R [Citrus sinensis]
MENIQLNTSQLIPENLIVDKGFDREKDVNLNQENRASAMEEEDGNEESFVDSMLCDSNSRLIPCGFIRSYCTGEFVLFVNAGGEASDEVDCSMKFLGDTYFEGGNVLRTNEHICDAGDYPFIYQSARFGNFCYRFNDIPPGHYYVDLHFAEIINTNGPKGMRVFNVVSDFDIFSIVGANKPLQLVDIRVSVKEEGTVVVRFEGISGSPAVSGICIRRASKVLSVPQTSHEFLKCNNCAAEIEVPSAQKKIMRIKATEKYEKKIEELNKQFQLKTNECHEAWMSLTAANEQLEKVRMELDNKAFQTLTLDQTVEKQAENLINITSRYECDKKYWAAAVSDLQEKVKMMKKEHSQLSREAHECADSIPELNKMVIGVQALGNIRVFCRCRPLNKVEISAGCATVVDFDAAKDGELGVLTGSSTRKTFKFDRVFTPNDGQVDVFADASPLVISVLDGYNVCIFAYGQTGTGKTFTMEGTEQSRGVNYRTLEQLFEIAKERSETFTYNISVSVLEVYNEQIRDLLATSPTSKKLEIKQSSEGSHHVPGIVEANVNSIREAWNVLQTGSSARAVGSNNVNEHSSRSHCMLCIMVRAKNLISGECTKSKLWLVDLAGSERLTRTDVQGDRLKEAQNINRSLSALGDVIYSLATKSNHIPYRNSKLTHLLQDSLGGDSKTLMFVQISPSEQDLSETLSSLNFATRVRGVELGPARKQIDTSELQKMKVMVDKQASQLLERLKGREELCSTLQIKVKDIENKLKEQERESESHSISLQHKVKELESKLKEQERQHVESLMLRQKIKELEDKLKEQEQQFQCRLSRDFADLIKYTPNEVKTSKGDDEVMSDIDLRILRSSNSVNRPMSHGSILPRGNGHQHETRKKRDSRSGETENNNILKSSSYENKKRKSDPPRVAATRVMRTAKPVTATIQGPSVHKRINRDQVQGIKERDTKKKIWSR